MEQNYYVYKLFNPDCTEFYIGSTTDLKERKRCHKYCCTNENNSKYNMELYKYIREHGGYSNWNYQILEHITTSINKYELRDLERKAIENMKPSLNCKIPNRSKNEYMEKYRENNKEQIKEYDKQYRENNKEQIKQKQNEKFNCICGGKYTRNHKARHTKTRKHQNFINQ